MPGPSTVIGLDIGGTKIQAGVVTLPTAIVIAEELSTPRVSPPAFYDALSELVRRLQSRAASQALTLAPWVGVAHPGRFLPDRTLARSTTPNLGTRPNEFDGIAPARELSRRLHLDVWAENDAIAQMRHGLALLLADAAARPRLLGQTVVYLGPGTGMGGGVAQVSRTKQVTVVTDGHFFDLQLPGVGDGTLTAEEVFTGSAIARLVRDANASLAQPIEPARAGQLDEILKAPRQAPAGHLTVAERIAAATGEVLAELVATIHAGRIVKVRLEPAPDGSVARYVDEPDRAWPEADRRLVRGASRLILGGFVGSSLGFGKAVRARALEALRQRGLEAIELFQIPVGSGDAGLLGIVTAYRNRITI